MYFFNLKLNNMNYYLTFLQAQPSIGSGNWTFIILLIIIGSIVYGVRLYRNMRRKNNPTINKDNSSKYFYVSKQNFLGIFGAIVGFFLSILFQNGGIRSLGMSNYLRNLSDLSDLDGVKLNIFISIALFAAIGALIGHFLDAQTNKEDSQS